MINPSQEKLQEYGQETVEYGKNQLYPQAKVYGSIAREWISTNLAHGWRWLVAIVSPKVNTIYRKVIEPQVNKIIDRIFENTERALTSKSDTRTSTTDFDDTTSSVESEDNIEFVQATETGQDPKSNAEKPFGESTSYQHNTDWRRSTNADEEDEEEDEFKNVDIVKELDFWKAKVENTNKEALESFERDIKFERERVLEKHRPEFNKHLFSLQKYQQNGFVDLRTLITMIESNEDDDETLSHEMIENKVKMYTDEIEETIEKLQKQTQRAELEIRVRTEALRDNTIEILDVFSNVMISELGRKLVSQDNDQVSSKGRWEDWKEFTSLKDQLEKTRDTVTKYKIPLIADIVSQIQVTAQVLTEEAKQHALALKGKADHLLILRNKKRDTPVVDDSEVEFYDAEEEDMEARVEPDEVESDQTYAVDESIEDLKDSTHNSLETSSESTKEQDNVNDEETVTESSNFKEKEVDTEPNTVGAKDTKEKVFEKTDKNTQPSSVASTTIVGSATEIFTEFTATVSDDYIQDTSSQNESTVTSTNREEAEYTIVEEDEDYDLVDEKEEYDVVDYEAESEAFEIVFENKDDEKFETYTSTKTQYVTVTQKNTATFSSSAGSAGSSFLGTDVTVNTVTVSTAMAEIINDNVPSEIIVSKVYEDETEAEDVFSNEALTKSTSYTTKLQQQTKVLTIEKDEL